MSAKQQLNQVKADKNARTTHSSIPGTAKKGGAGGKYTWGAPGSEEGASAALDKNDPNYESDEESPEQIENRRAEETGAYKKGCDAILKEYFSSADIWEAATSLQELGDRGLTAEFVKRALISALERNSRDRELTSRLISALYGDLIPSYVYYSAFNQVIARLPDLVLDTPNAAELVGMFLARAVVDEIIPPKFIKEIPCKTPLEKEAVSKASLLLEGNNVAQRLEQLWGPSALQSPSTIKQRYVSICEEYVNSLDVDEVARSINEMSVPDFHYALVKVAVTVALSSSNPKTTIPHLSSLLNELTKRGLLSSEKYLMGLKCCVASIADLSKDFSPKASEFVSQFISLASEQGHLDGALCKEFAETMEQNIQADKIRLAGSKAN